MVEYRVKISAEALLSLIRTGKADIGGSLVYPCEYDNETGELCDTGECGEMIDIIEVI